MTERRVCMVCGRVLDYWEAKGWVHSFASQDPGELDHPPIPVSPEEAGEQLRARCDFCYADYPEYRLPVRTFGRGASVSVGDWAACDGCARCIEKDEWNRLMDRVVTSWESRHGPMSAAVTADLKRMYRQLRKNITGPLHREDER